MAQAQTTPTDPEVPGPEDEDSAPACVMSFNANDPSGAGGLSADVLAISSAGAHALAVVTGAYSRDTAEILDHFAFDEDAVAEQARAALEDMPVAAIKVGFVGSTENVSTIAEIASDYADVPLVAYMPNLSWWDESELDSYLDAFRELMLPQTTVLIGNHSTLWRWLLPDWSGQSSPSPRDIAKAAGELGVPYTLSAALSALLANGHDLQSATAEALTFLDQSLNAGFQPGMGHLVPDRMFWAQAEDDENPDDPSTALPLSPTFDVDPHATKH